MSIINVWLIIHFELFSLAFLLVNYGLDELIKMSVNSLFGFINLLIIAFSNTGLIIFFDRYKEKMPFLKLKRTFVFTSYLLNLVFILLGLVIYSFAIANIELTLFKVVGIVVLAFILNTFILILQHYVLLQDAKIQTDLENSKLRAVNSETANQLLRQQIHPHFLFNALNVLKSLYRVRPNDGEEYLMLLSEFLRAAVSTNNIKVWTLKEELDLCINYIEMQKIRFDSVLQYSISISDEMLANGHVPSFSIQPLIENAIKHNKLTEETPLIIEIVQDGDRITVKNNLNPKMATEDSTGSGLGNLSERYRLISADDLSVDKGNDYFLVSIKVFDSVHV